MKVIELVKYGSSDNAFKISERDIPQPRENEVLIKVNFTGLNFADVVARRGLYPDAPKNPAVLGYDVVGVIESVGQNVSHLKKGDKVTALTRFGGYAQYVTTSIAGVAKIPNHIDEASATALATQACTAYYSGAYMVNLRKSDKVLIHAAAGGVGNMLCQIAKIHGCEVLATASPSKHEFLKSLGVDHCIDYRSEDFSHRVKEILKSDKLDFVFDSIGGKTFRKSIKLMGPCGTMVSYGAASQIHGNNKLKAIGAALGFGIFSPISFLMKSQSLITVNMLRVADSKPVLFNEILSSVIALAESGKLSTHLSEIFDYNDVAKAHSFLESRASIGKVVLRW